MTYELKAHLRGNHIDILKELATIVQTIEDAVAADAEFVAGQALSDDGEQTGAWMFRRKETT